ncbi:peptidylprolyl isomerase domain and WD repeat-containing protein 1 [Octopus sinensis]|uniref:Peptidylprolyl isomerase domain and WD repeat-containing protein 1 n=1 Tax=Octopus sinensis TaxID=2607531 RepID=A0A6P7TY13_9MOLL|nr:peptidylprolyl isomerase domain and WD repeat-containing protein 1 [Octopus sinensis]
MAENRKRNLSEKEAIDKNPSVIEDDDDVWIGPMPHEAQKPKKKKVLEYEQVYLDNLPSAETYEYSYMHRDVIAHITVTKSGFIITASIDGHVKFWRKLEEAGIEFVKHFRSHLGNIEDVSASSNGEYYCTISNDKSVKVFDVVNFG